MKTKENTLRKWILAATAIIVLIAIGILFMDQLTKKSEKTEVPEKIQDKLEEIPEDVRNIRAKIGKDKVYINKKGYWEADYGDGIIMVYIPAGKFKMGQTEEEKYWLINQIGKEEDNKYDRNILRYRSAQRGET